MTRKLYDPTAYGSVDHDVRTMSIGSGMDIAFGGPSLADERSAPPAVPLDAEVIVSSSAQPARTTTKLQTAEGSAVHHCHVTAMHPETGGDADRVG